MKESPARGRLTDGRRLDVSLGEDGSSTPNIAAVSRAWRELVLTSRLFATFWTASLSWEAMVDMAFCIFTALLWSSLYLKTSPRHAISGKNIDKARTCAPHA